ncbi:DUF86 domain-containing protein [Rhizobium grahamii]|uniref:DUF86 domain-containing protein n=1 Tax=Rhizobium grahamii TaxID=1120045 RepID=A0A5Q0CB02_9HYPH|nr:MULTISPECIES: HepT-like ribonuclease domain-containing protein [Rhizobium]QFY60879.1 DUF86 domain-containing protein [Rhizobium grahamii]QRM49974.1 DUF86 domain-containing protein [Rhizobium sp. BG6]
MSAERLADYIDRMHAAAEQARMLTENMDEEAFLSDLRTQLAVTMSLVLLGEAASRIATSHPDFLEEHQELPWARICGMRNLIVHDYYRADLSAIWTTVRRDLQTLISELESLRHWRIQGE